MHSHLLSPLMPNARQLVEQEPPWHFDEKSSANLALLNAIGVLGAMREAELALFFRAAAEPDEGSDGYGDDHVIRYPALDGSGYITANSAVHATRRRLLSLVDSGLLATARTGRTTEANLAGWHYWLTRKGSRYLLDAGYRVRARQNIHAMSHVGSAQDQHRLLEQQFLIARRLINPNLRIWGEYALRSSLARSPKMKGTAKKLQTASERLVDMSAELHLTPKELDDAHLPHSVDTRYFTRRPDALLFDEQPEVARNREEANHNPESRPARAFGDVEWCEVEASKKDASTQARSFNGLFYLGLYLDATLERGKVTKVVLVTRNHPTTDLRTKLLDSYENWLEKADVRAMLAKKARLTPGFDPGRLNEQLWLAELTQGEDHRLTGIRTESVASIFLRDRRGDG